MSHNICFIGAGNMARSIIGGLVAKGTPGQNICASDPKPEALKALEQDFNIRSSVDNAQACAQADVVILAVKPQVMGPVCQALAPCLPPHALVVSIAAGIDCASLQDWLGSDKAIVRCMPNTPSLVKKGASGLFANPNTQPEQKQLAEAVMSAVGTVDWLEQEQLLDPVTAVSGSGPAYFFLFLEAMVDAGVELGLDRGSAQRLAIQTAAGAAELAANSDVDLAELRRRVTSPGGTTEQAIKVFENRELRAIVREAMTACAQRSVELAQELGSSSNSKT